MFQLTCFGWLLFRAGSFHQIATMTKALAHPLAGFDGDTAVRVALIISPLLVAQAIQSLSKKLEFLAGVPSEVRVVVYSVFAYFVLFLGGQPQAFIYFQF